MPPRMTDPIRRDCTCPCATHVHGTHQAYISDRCRCDDCCAAKMQYQRKLRLRHAAHQSWGGDPVMVDATGSRRRLQALQRIGYSIAALAVELERTKRAVMFYRDKYVTIRHDHAARIAAVYDRLWDKPPPPSTGTLLARRNAEARGWPPPLAWDDDEIDDPQAAPHHVAEVGHPDEFAIRLAVDERVWGVPLSTEETRIVVARLSDRGLSSADISDQIGISERHVVRLRKQERNRQRNAAKREQAA